MKILKTILIVSFVSLLATGLIHFAFIDWIFKDASYYLILKWVIGKITLGLTIIVLQIFVILLTLVFSQKDKPKLTWIKDFFKNK